MARRQQAKRGEGRSQNYRATPSPAAAEPPARSRTGTGRYVFGINPVTEALRARPEQIELLLVGDGQLSPSHAAELFSRAREAGVRVQQVSRDRLATLAEGGVHQGVLAEMREFTYSEIPDLLAAAQSSGRPALVVVLDGIQDPQNLGAIIRSAHALGAHGVVVPKDRAAGITGTVAKASAGAIEHCKVARVVNLSRALEELKQAGLWIAAADPHSREPLWKARLTGPLALVVGAEGEGVRKGVLEHCDFRLCIPMTGQVASLNASVSAALLLYEVARQRVAGN
jgi:23S rRNA (guanosine2251-2'-O)-methyltransferase